MKTLKHNKLINRKNKLTHRKSKLIHRKSKLIHRKSKLIHRKSKLIHRQTKIKKGGNRNNPSILYLTKIINYYKDIISNPFLFNEDAKKSLLKSFKHNIDNIYKSVKVLDLLYNDLDKKFYYKGEYAKARVEFYFKFMRQLKNNVMMFYLPIQSFYNNTKCYLYPNCNVVNNNYNVFNKKLIKQFIDYFIDILSYQTINYDLSKQSELNIYVKNNSELTQIINQIIYHSIDGNSPEHQSEYLYQIANLFNILRKPTKEISIVWSTDNYENIILEEILKLYDQVMIFAETIQYHINEKKIRERMTQSFFSKTYYNNAYIDSQYKFVREYIKNILDFYYVINKIFTDSTLHDIILKYPIIDKIINDKDNAKDIIDNPHEYITNNNNNNLLSGYLGDPSNNYSQQPPLSTETNKGTQSKMLKTLSSFETYKGESNNDFLRKLMGQVGEQDV